MYQKVHYQIVSFKKSALSLRTLKRLARYMLVTSPWSKGFFRHLLEVTPFDSIILAHLDALISMGKAVRNADPTQK